MGYVSSLRRYAALDSRVRAEVFAITVKLADESAVECAKSPPSITDIPAEQGVGHIQRVVAVFTFAAAGEFVPALGDQWEITASEVAAEIGTRWQCREYRPAVAGMDHRCVCFRLD